MRTVTPPAGAQRAVSDPPRAVKGGCRAPGPPRERGPTPSGVLSPFGLRDFFSPGGCAVDASAGAGYLAGAVSPPVAWKHARIAGDSAHRRETTGSGGVDAPERGDVRPDRAGAGAV